MSKIDLFVSNNCCTLLILQSAWQIIEFVITKNSVTLILKKKYILFKELTENAIPFVTCFLHEAMWRILPKRSCSSASLERIERDITKAILVKFWRRREMASTIVSNSTCGEVMLVTFDCTSHIERIVIKEMTAGTWAKQRSTASLWVSEWSISIV